MPLKGRMCFLKFLNGIQVFHWKWPSVREAPYGPGMLLREMRTCLTAQFEFTNMFIVIHELAPSAHVHFSKGRKYLLLLFIQ